MAPVNAGAITTDLNAEDELREFDKVFKQIVDDLCQCDKEESVPIKQVLDWYRQVLVYNVPHGKKTRGITVVNCYKQLALHDTHVATDAYTMMTVRVLGWCVEILQAFLLVADDIMDESETRRGQTCWYKRDGVGLIAINDAMYLENCMFKIVYKYFRDHPAYPQILDLFHQTTYNTIIGQTLDMLSSAYHGTPQPMQLTSLYTEDRYASIAKYKTAYYSFYLPVALALCLCHVRDERQILQARDILLLMGHLFQVQDDYLDCFGDVKITGKVGNDIEEAKCSWLIVQALKLGDREQRRKLQEGYGKLDAASVSSVKCVYKELELERLYTEYEESCYSQLLTLINDTTLPKFMFTQLVNKIYKRNK